ncbi:ATP-binding protein [Salinarimonas sp. NSM]|uniref:ATP-binding protein n=1 Tax=Salinarimonas sp. NSM TaxID=3458003 RepID=UPI0040362D60
MISVLIALTLGSAASLWLEVERYGEQKRERLLAVAHAFAAASAEAVAAHDRDSIFEAVRAISRLPDITHVTVTDRTGAVLEEIGSGVRLVGDLVLDDGTPLSVTAVLSSRTAVVGVPVRHRGVEVGRLELTSETGDLWGRLLVVLAFGLGAAVVASAIGLAIAWRLQRAITRPLLTLSATMQRVREAHDYDEACPVESDDEIGQLALGFNAMLGEIRRRDARLAQHRERLESEVEERTRDLATAKDAAERASSAKSDFLATMSHEIRTPMNGMLVMAELLAAGDLPERQRRYAEVIARSGQSLLAIINDILDFAKVEAGKLELEAAPVDLGEAVETVVTLFGERAAGKGLDLAAAVDPALPRIVGDPVRLTQVIANLVNNALKFTETGHVLVRVAAADGRVTIHVEDTGIGIPEEKRATIFSAFSQADQSTTRRFGGTGLGLSIVQRLVAAMGGEIRVESVLGEGSCFVVELPCIAMEDGAPAAPRLDASRVAIVAAAGAATRTALSLGLAAAGFDLREPDTTEPDTAGPDADWIVDADALLRTGRPPGARRVLALSPIGERAGEEARARGLADALLRRPLAPSEWTLALARLVDGGAFPREEAARDGAAAALPCFPGARVLVADDSAVNREVACEALSRLGIAARTVTNGREALDAITAGGIDLVLMDGSMPELDGFEATRLTRAHEAGSGTARTPIVALTAHVVGAGAEAWREAGMDGVLHKPFTLAALAQVLGAHLPASGSAIAGTAPVEVAGAPAGEATSDPEALLDEEVVAGIAEMAQTTGAGFLRRILGLYLEHAPPALAQLVAAVAEGAEPAQVASAAHALKSMSLNVGAAALAARLAAIEAAARDPGTLPDATALGTLAPLLAETIAALRAGLGEEEPEVDAAAVGRTALKPSRRSPRART